MSNQSKRSVPRRASSTIRKSTRERSWSRCEGRKKARVAEQRRREAVNRELRAEGKLTPWEQACRERHARRHPVPAISPVSTPERAGA